MDINTGEPVKSLFISIRDKKQITYHSGVPWVSDVLVAGIAHYKVLVPKDEKTGVKKILPNTDIRIMIPAELKRRISIMLKSVTNAGFHDKI